MKRVVKNLINFVDALADKFAQIVADPQAVPPAVDRAKEFVKNMQLKAAIMADPTFLQTLLQEARIELKKLKNRYGLDENARFSLGILAFGSSTRFYLTKPNLNPKAEMAMEKELLTYLDTRYKSRLDILVQNYVKANQINSPDWKMELSL